MSDVSVSFGADTSGLDDGIKKVAAQIDGFGSSLTSAMSDANGGIAQLSASFEKLGADIAKAMTGTIGEAALAATAAIGAFAALAGSALGLVTERAVSLGMGISGSSAQLGETVENVSRLAPVAAAAGMSLGDLTKKFSDLREKLRTGDDDVQNALKALKIDPGTFKTEGAAEQMQTLNGAVSSLADSYAKSAALQKLFGDSAAQLLPVLDRNAAGYQTLAGAAQRAGIVLDESMIARLRGTMSIMTQVGDNFHEAGFAIQGLATAIYGALKPAIDSILQGFANVVGSIARFIEGLTKAVTSGGAFTAFLGEVKSELFDMISWANTFAADWDQLTEFMGKSWDTLWNGLTETVRGFNTDLKDDAAGFFNGLAETGKRVLGALGQAFVDLGHVIKLAFTGSFKDAAAALGDLDTRMSDAIAHSMDGFAEFAKQSKGVGAWNQTLATMQSDFAAFSARLTEENAKARKDLAAQWAKPITMPKLGGGDAGNMPGAAKSVDRDAVKAAMDEIQGEIKVLQEGLAQKKVIFDAEAAQFKITQNQKFAMLEEETQKEYEAQLALLQKELQIPNLKPQQTQQINNQIKELQVKHTTDMISLDKEAVAASQKTWQGYFDMIQGGFNSQLKGLLAGTTSWKQAMGNIFNDLLVKFIEMVEKMVFQWAAGELANTTASVTGAAQRAAAQTAGAAASSAASLPAILASIRASAAEAFAGVAGFLSPVLGPAAVGPAAATEATVLAAAAGLQSVASFDVGAWNLPTNMLAMVHQGETILPAKFASSFRDLVNNASGATSGGGDTHNWTVNVQPTSAMMSSQQFMSLLQSNIRQAAQAVSVTLNKNQSLRPAY